MSPARPGMSRIPMEEVGGNRRDSIDFSGEACESCGLPVVEEGGVGERLFTLRMIVATTLLYKLTANPSLALKKWLESQSRVNISP